jgi:hypothetical protein
MFQSFHSVSLTSQGMVVAIVAAVRTGWKDEGNDKDVWYFWRNAHSNIWYSSEIVGTIIVQCIPVLRPLLRDMHTSMTSRKLASAGGDTKRRSKAPTTIGSHAIHRAPGYADAQRIYSDKSGDLDLSWDSSSMHRAHIYSDAKGAYNDRSGDHGDARDSHSMHRANIYSDAKITHNEQSVEPSDSRSSEGIFQTKSFDFNFEMTPLDATSHRDATSLV